MTIRSPRALAGLVALLAAMACGSTASPPVPPTHAPPPSTRSIAGYLEEVRLEDGHVVIRQGEDLLEFRISLSGDVLDPSRTNVRDPNGYRIPLAEIAIGTPVSLYWHTHADHPGERTAKMIQIMRGLPRAPAPE